jgi:hypothetical protein
MTSRRVWTLILTLLVLSGGAVSAQQNGNDSLLLDDFSRPDGQSVIGTEWEGFTDQVMGGRSDMSAGVRDTETGPAMHMTGSVSLENNGGFIQVRLNLAEDGFFDARDFRGVEIEARGTGDHYYLHLRNARTRFPWAYYAAELPVSEQWSRIRVPFDDFQGEYMIGGGKIDVGRLRSVAVVAAQAEFDADIWVRSISLYK